MAATPVVGIVGARALRADIRKLAEDQRSPLYAGMKEAARIALAPVALEAASRLPSSGRKNNKYHQSGELKSSIRLQVLRTGGGVRMGPPSRRFAGWVEFGGNRHRPHESSRQYVKTGRYLFPAARDLSSRAAETYATELQKVFDHYQWTNTGDNVHD